MHMFSPLYWFRNQFYLQHIDYYHPKCVAMCLLWIISFQCKEKLFCISSNMFTVVIIFVLQELRK
ncbi:hypothetical protein AALP_AA4G180900 [Arabis alpina]|uniref:Uncharacterized protein n=1 Tax=Arabis alpina TaxID=50452 RepID=A0A087H407_ARAAL|nr:hypothetical protein AALP_AA4G180900 [Arabis alpina]